MQEKKQQGLKALKHLNKYLLKYKYHLILGFLFVAISNVFGVYAPKLVRNAFDLVSETYNSYMQLKGSEQESEILKTFGKSTLYLGLMYLGLAVLKGVFMFFMRQTLIVMSRHIEYDLKNEIFDHYQKLDLAFYKRNNTGDLMNRISEDVSRVRMYIGPAIMYTINLVALFVLVIGTMISVNATLTFYVLLPLPILSIAIYYVSSVMNKKSDLVQEQLSKLSSFAQENFSGIRVIKAYNKEDSSLKSFETASAEYNNRCMDLVKVNALFYPTMLLLIGLSTLLTIFIGGMEAIKGNITVGNIAEFVIYVNMLTWPVTSVGWVTSLMQRAAASQQRINEFLNQQPAINNGQNNFTHIKGFVEFKNVSFTYPGSGIQALKNISFKVEPGKTLAIIGRTGSGKSTISQLISRLYDASEGEILIDGKNIKSYNLKNLRSAISAVPQEVFLFSDSIYNNIDFGETQGNISREAIEQAAKDAAVYSNIIEFANGFNTVVGERGITLSGGQKQRITLARALIKNAPVLILDDCLSAVDTETEENILQNLKKYSSTRSIIIISHRVSSVKNAENIIVLDDGKIIESGTHEELLNAQKSYSELYQKQLLEEEKQHL
jgi:ATP-binding cassette, subfamily B, multidrug efflux pump